jgi:hypothetical protein
VDCQGGAAGVDCAEMNQLGQRRGVSGRRFVGMKPGIHRNEFLTHAIIK